jgi:hypothetical protein
VDHPAEVRCAAAVVLGEVGGRDSGVAQALCGALDDPDSAVRARVLTAIGKLRIEKALPRLLARISEGGVEAELAAEAAANLGAKGTHALQELMPRVAPGLRRRIAAALAAGGTASAETAAVEVLLDSDPNVVDASVRSLIAKVPTLENRHRQTLAEHLLELLGTKKRRDLSAHSEAALVRLLAALGDPRAEAVFWARVEPPHPPELRAAALQALGTLSHPSGREKLKRLLLCAADGDFRVAAPALMILKTTPVNERNLEDWLPLFQSADPAARHFAVEKLGDKDHPKVAVALLSQLDHPDRSLRELALKCLGQLTQGREALARKLLEAESPDQAWALARGQVAFARDYPAALRTKLFTRACAYLEAADRRADPLLFLLRESDGHDLRDRLEERALALRKKGQYASALIYLRLLTRDPACGDPIRFELAACGLKVSEHDLAADARAADPCLEQFAGLLRRHEIKPLEWIEKAKWLDADDLFYLGFHFVEGGREDKDFGAGVLRLLIRRSPRSKHAKDAKNKLRSQGLQARQGCKKQTSQPGIERERLTMASYDYCPAGRTFYRLRRVLVRTLGLARHDIRPAMRLDELIPPDRRRTVWQALRQEGLRLPDLCLMEPLGRIGGVVMLATVLAVAISGSLWRLIVAVHLAWICWRVTRPIAIHLDPTGPVTVRDAVIYLTSFRSKDHGGYPWSHREISLKVRLILAESLGLPLDKVKPESRLIEDLGC